MNKKLSIQDLIEKIAERNKVTKKLSEDWLRLLPEVIETGLLSDGLVKVRGLGTFRLKWIEKRIARNLKTGEEVEVPAHNRVIFQAEKKVKEIINEDYKYLSYSVIDEEGKPSATPAESPRPEPVSFSEPAPTKPEKAQPEPDAATAPLPPVPPGKKPQTARRKYYWVVPVTFLLIIILAIIFYLRNCTKNAEYARPEQKEQVIAPTQPEAGVSEKDTVSSGQLEETSRPEAASSRQDEAGAQAAPVELSRETVMQTPEKVIVTDGEWLFQLAREHYGNPFLWVLIYQANKDQISNPDNLAKGLTLTLPGLEGTPRNLSRQDSISVAEGYRLVYEYYSSRGDQRADGFYQEVMKYSPY